MKLTEQQITLLRCVYADLKGAKEAHDSWDSSIHDWGGHAKSIEEMEKEFPFVKE
jgi:hypothetical protein